MTTLQDLLTLCSDDVKTADFEIAFRVLKSLREGKNESARMDGALRYLKRTNEAAAARIVGYITSLQSDPLATATAAADGPTLPFQEDE